MLALAAKMIKISHQASQSIERGTLERELIFLGFFIVENKLKNETIPTIEILNKANYKLIMATGDNLFTGVAVSQSCGIVSKKASIYQRK